MADSGMDMKAHAGTYDGFIAMMKYGTVATAIVAAIVVALIAS